jgi:hypothetical protein
MAVPGTEERARTHDQCERVDIEHASFGVGLATPVHRERRDGIVFAIRLAPFTVEDEVGAEGAE